MRKKINIYNLIIFIVGLLIMSGCGDNSVQVLQPDNSGKEIRESMLEEAEILYEMPQTIPSISVDRSGYDLNDKKEAIICAHILPSKFVIKDAASKETVFTGYIKKADVSVQDGLEAGYADFSEFDSVGTYYIETEILGCSENFDIIENIYLRKLVSAVRGLDSLKCENCHASQLKLESDSGKVINVSGGWHTGDNGQKDVVEGCLSVMDLLLAYEYFGSSFTDDLGIASSGNGVSDIVDLIRYEVDWLLKMQNPSSGGVYTAVAENTSSRSEFELVVVGETTKATAYYCATMARTGYIFNSFDKELSQRCMKAANLAWKCLEANKDIVGKDQIYRAAVEMYRATGYAIYNDVILSYLKDNHTNQYESRLVLDAAISYLDTPRNTNKDYCSDLMALFMDRTEAYEKEASESVYFVNGKDKAVKDLLRNSCELALVDYIISSSAYAKTEKNYLHYIGGRNEDSINKIYFGNDPDAYAELILVLGRLIK